MAPRQTSPFIKTVKDNWNIAFQLSLTLVLILNKFVIPINGTSALIEGQIDNQTFGRFLVACLLLLAVLPAKIFSNRNAAKYWWAGSVSLLLFSLFFNFSIYNRFADDHTVWSEYEDRLVVIGDRYLPEIDSALKADLKRGAISKIDPQTALFRIADGDVEKVWDRKEIDHNNTLILIYYLSLISCYSLVVICIVQSIFCSTQKK